MPKKRKTKKTMKKRAVKRTQKKSVFKSAEKAIRHSEAFALINKKLSKLEAQALKAYKHVKVIRRRATPAWKELFGSCTCHDWLSMAGSEIQSISNDILSKINDEYSNLQKKLALLERKTRKVSKKKKK